MNPRLRGQEVMRYILIFLTFIHPLLADAGSFFFLCFVFCVLHFFILVFCRWFVDDVYLGTGNSVVRIFDAPGVHKVSDGF